MIASIIQTLVVRRYACFAAALLMAASVGWGITRTSTDTGSGALLSESDAYAVEVEQARQDFPSNASVMFVFETDTDVFNLQTLRAMEALEARFSEIEGAISVGSLLSRRFNDDDAVRYERDYLIPLLDDLTEVDLGAIREIALADDDLTKRVISPTGDMALASVKYTAAPNTREARLAVGKSIYALRDSLREAYPDVRIYTLGNVLFELDGQRATVKDRMFLFPIVIAVSIFLLRYCLKSLPYTLCLFAIAFVSVGLSVGSFGWLGIEFNQISALGPLVVLVVAMAHGIHIAAIYAQGLAEGRSKVAAMQESLLVNLQPVTLASVTTAMGFLCLNYSSSPAIYGFGNVVAIGVLWAFVMTLMLLPTLLVWLPANKIPKPLGVQQFIATVSHVVRTRGNVLFWGASLLILVTLAMLPLNKLDFNRYSFVDEDSDLHHVITALADKIGNDQALVYSIQSGEYYGITEPDFLGQVETFSRWVEAQPEASFVSSYTDLLRSLNKSEHDDDPAYDVIPTDKLQIIDYLVSYQLIQELEPNLEPIFNSDYSTIRVVIGTSNLTNGELIGLNDRIYGWLRQNLDPRYDVLHGNNTVRWARLDQTIATELMKGFGLSFVLITLTMLIGLRSVTYGFISILPNVAPATIVFGFWGIFIGELSPYILMIFSISIGLVVDDSVHMLSKYITARKRGSAPEDAVDYSLDKAGSAITITTVSLSIGVFILVFSNTFHFQNVAVLLAPIILVAWLLDLLYLPPLLIRFDNWRERRRSARPWSEMEKPSQAY
ncbi:MAG: hypothetical protein CMQ29_14995 [Gammaproteobacteria bacterium]|nr:hypothetical protein [Gammaproteobacteria bacterium]